MRYSRINLLNGGAVISRIVGHILLLQIVVNKGGNAVVDDDKYGNAQKHTPKAEESAEENDGEHDPEAVDSQTAAEDFGLDVGSVNLLENNIYIKITCVCD